MTKKATYKFGGILVAVLIAELLIWIAFFVAYFVILKSIPGIRLARPDLIWAMAAGPLVLLLFLGLMGWKNHSLRKFSNTSLLPVLAPDISSVKAAVKFVLYRLAITFLVVALINPQSGGKMAEASYRGIDIMAAVDVSNSMLAQDIKPNRLERAKRSLEQLIENLHGDRLGMIVFAGRAYVQLPITTDYSAAKLFLTTVNTDVVPVQGTNIGAAIDLAVESFDKESPANKAIVVITDGEDHQNEAVEAAQRAAEKGIKVFTIGMGSENGAPVPQFANGRQIGFKQNDEGETVISKLNEATLRQIADAGKGNFVRASNAGTGLQQLLTNLNQIEKTDMGSVVYSDYEDQFQIFLGIAIFCLLIDFLLSEKKGFLRKRVKLFRR